MGDFVPVAKILCTSADASWNIKLQEKLTSWRADGKRVQARIDVGVPGGLEVGIPNRGSHAALAIFTHRRPGGVGSESRPGASRDVAGLVELELGGRHCGDCSW